MSDQSTQPNKKTKRTFVVNRLTTKGVHLDLYPKQPWGALFISSTLLAPVFTHFQPEEVNQRP